MSVKISYPQLRAFNIISPTFHIAILPLLEEISCSVSDLPLFVRGRPFVKV